MVVPRKQYQHSQELNAYIVGGDILFLFLIFTLYNQAKSNNDENLCENQKDGIFVQNPEKCELFYQCRNGEPLLASCPEGMYFDPKSGICDMANNVFCKHDFIDPEINDEIIECPEDENKEILTFIASTIDCNRYYICYHGNPIKQECIPELHFNNKTKRCDFKENAKCTITNIRCGPEFHKHTLPHPINCSLYYYCILGLPLIQRCPFYHHFDISSRSCKWQNKSNCFFLEQTVSSLPGQPVPRDLHGSFITVPA
ncbi:protein obstructor-E-like [Condylostylus longicornis]|uniref:protein obstructor-E-like n=1 Tax=Condylostylus longicornis TaxID=2530218 RepID=UPI00244E413B|nr:protein obstructor-E-like [Condylostylus longicornis]